MKNRLLTKKELQDYLGIGHNTTLKLLNKREFSFKIGNKWYCDKELLEQWMDNQILYKKRSR